MLVHLLWATVAVYAVHSAARVGLAFAPMSAKGTEAEEVAIPDDLMAFAMSQSEQWAQEEAVRAIQQNYELWKDWNRVRAAMSIGRMSS
jgi:hypothetical protein